MPLRRTLLAAAATLPLALPARAQAPYPAKPIRLVVPFPPGGGTDILARLVAAKLSEVAQWSVVADNRAGAGGTIGIAETAKAQPDGYELVMGQKDNLVVAPWLYKNLSYDPVKNLTAIAHVAYAPVIVTTAAGSRFRTLADVARIAREQPGTVTYGSPGNGTTIHLAAEIFRNAAHIDIRHVPYKGSGPALMDTLAGNVDLMVSSIPSAMSQIKAGKLRALAVTSARRSSALPDVPTVAESGYPGFDVSTWYGVLGPAGLPQAVVQKVNAEVNRLLALPDVQKSIHEQGAEPQAMTPAQFATLLRTDVQKWQAIVRDSGATIG